MTALEVAEMVARAMGTPLGLAERVAVQAGRGATSALSPEQAAHYFATGELPTLPDAPTTCRVIGPALVGGAWVVRAWW
jgi:hypothetical protein